MLARTFWTLALALSTLTADTLGAPEYPTNYGKRRFADLHDEIRDMAQEFAESFKRNAPTSTCRPFTDDDITTKLSNEHIDHMVTLTDAKLNSIYPGASMFQDALDKVQDEDFPDNRMLQIANWRKDTDVWVLGDEAEWRNGVDLPNGRLPTTSYWVPVTAKEQATRGWQVPMICLNATLAVKSTLTPNQCQLATFDARGTMADGGSVQVSIQQATTLTTTVTTEKSTTAGESLSTTYSGGLELGFLGSSLSGGTERTTETHWEVTNNQGKENSTSTSVTNTVQISFNQLANQSCYVELTTQTCQARYRVVTPIVLSGFVRIQTRPYCRYNRVDNFVYNWEELDCLDDLVLDIGQATAGAWLPVDPNSDAAIVQDIDASLTSTGTYKQRCVNDTTSLPSPATNVTTNVTTSLPAPIPSTVTIYGHTATSYALTTTVAEKTATKSVITEFYQPTVTVYQKTKDVATATVFSKTITLNAANAKTTTVTSTRRPPASTTHRSTTVFRSTRTVTTTPTTTISRRVTQTLKPTRCRRSIDDAAKAGGVPEIFIRSEPTAVPMPVLKRDDAPPAPTTTTLTDATTTFTEPVLPTTVTAIGSTTTVTSAVSGTQTLAAVTTTDSVNVQYNFRTLTTVSTAIASRITSTTTIRLPARTSTVTDTVTRASTTKTVQGRTSTVRRTRTVTVTPPCTRR